MKNYKNIITNDFFKSLLIAFLASIFTSGFAQLVPRDGGSTSGGINMTVKGKFDIRMISSVALQPVWMKYGATNMDVVQAVTAQEQMKVGSILMSNNDLRGTAGQQNTEKGILAIAPTASKDVTGTKAQVGLAYTDCDTDPNTFQSSAAYLDFGADMGCTSVYKAYLYWVGSVSSTTNYTAYKPQNITMGSHAGGATGTATGNNVVKIKAPGATNYETVSAANGYTIRSISAASADGRYVNMADVTKYVQGRPGGLYWVADIRSSSDHSSSPTAGWSLIVIYTPPNCPPRVIKFWDGYQSVGSSTPSGVDLTMNFVTGEVPATGNSVSYMGVCALDAEAYASALMLEKNFTLAQMADCSISFSSKNASTSSSIYPINPFTSDQPAFSMLNSDGLPLYDNGINPSVNLRDGVLCSRISTWNRDSLTNGNDIRRLPDLKYTAGYDAHHYKLPTGSMVANATSAKATLRCERGSDCGGGYAAYLSYMAIQTLQPELKLSLKADSSTIKLNSEMTYTLTAKNIGPLAASAGSYMLDTLDKTIDYVPNSVLFFDKNNNPITPNFTIQNQGADSGELLKFTLPAIAAGNGVSSTDSISIKFKVKVKGADRTDIWGYSFNRNVKNRAEIIYKADDGSDLNSGSNSGASCDISGGGNYYLTPINDATLDAETKIRININDTLTQKVNAANIAGTKVYIVKTIKEILAKRLLKYNLPVADTSKYIIKDENDIAVSSSAYFTQNNPIQKYTAEGNFGNGLFDYYYLTLVVAKMPAWTIVSRRSPSCYGQNDGYMRIKITDGTPTYYCTVFNSSGNQIYAGCQPTASDPAYFELKDIPADKYKIVAGDQKDIDNTDYYILSDTTVLTVGLGADKSICKGEAVTLNASTPGLNYVWKERAITSSGTWTTRFETTQSITITPTASSDYIVYACNGYCQASDTIRVIVNPIPVVTLRDTTVSITINPTAIFSAKIKNGIGPYEYHWKAYNKSSWNDIPPTSSLLGTNTFTNDSILNISNITAASPNLEMNGYKYSVWVNDLASACKSKTDTASLTVVEGPSVTGTKLVNETCPGDADGTIGFSLAAGEPGQSYDVYLYVGDYPDSLSFANASPVPGVKKQIVFPIETTIESLKDCKASAYSVILVPKLPKLPGVKTRYYSPSNRPYDKDKFIVGSPEPLSVTLSGDLSACIGNKASVQAIILGGSKDGNKALIWEQNLAGAGFSPCNESVIDNGIKPKISDDITFRVYATDNGKCITAPAEHFVKALETPVLAYDLQMQVPVDTGCFKYDLHNLPVLQTNANLSDYTISLHSQKPFIEGDNSFLITEDKYIVNSATTVYARLYSGATCYSESLPIKIVIRSMESCYPIYIPEFFSPDGDGINDLFQMAGLEEYDNPQITIYDRYGKQVFKGGKKDLLPPGGWDGKYLGHAVPSGDYWYQMIFTELKPKVGSFSLKRRKE